MKLLYSHNSPYARRIRVAVREADLLPRVEEIDVSPIPDNLARITTHAAAGKVPVLVTDDGTGLCETLIIARYLDDAANGVLYDQGEVPGEQALELEGLACALMDSLFVRSRENRRDPGEQSPGVVALEKERANRLYDALEALAGSFGERATMDTISVGCALGYADGRHPDDEWRDGRQTLAGWFEVFSSRPSMAETTPAF